MAMRFRGSGVGHKSTRVATDCFLSDRDHLDLQGDLETETGDEEEQVALNVDDENLEGDSSGDEEARMRKMAGRMRKTTGRSTELKTVVEKDPTMMKEI
jgi:hypothetical protein